VKRNVALVVDAAHQLGFELVPRGFPEGTRTAEDAARAIGVSVGQIVKSLVFAVDDRPVLALVSGDNRLDDARLAKVAGGSTVQRLDANAVRDVTGFPVGGVPPFGHRTRLPSFVDRDLLAFDVVWAAAGTPHDNFSIDPKTLVVLTEGAVCDLAESV
jgi:Cys-tRNA(Pro) deacylase